MIVTEQDHILGIHLYNSHFWPIFKDTITIKILLDALLQCRSYLNGSETKLK